MSFSFSSYFAVWFGLVLLLLWGLLFLVITLGTLAFALNQSGEARGLLYYGALYGTSAFWLWIGFFFLAPRGFKIAKRGNGVMWRKERLTVAEVLNIFRGGLAGLVGLNKKAGS